MAFAVVIFKSNLVSYSSRKHASKNLLGRLGLGVVSEMNVLLLLIYILVAPSAGLRPEQRLRRRLHGLVPLPLLLRVQVSTPLNPIHIGMRGGGR